MSIYILNLIYTLFFGIIIYNSKIKNKNTIYLGTMLLILVVISSFRNYTVGTDTYTYLNYFDVIGIGNSSIWDYSMEPLFVLLNKIGYFISSNSQIILFLSALIINLLIILRVKDSSPYPWLSIYLFISMYIFYQSFNGMRQYIAIAITFYVSKYINEKSQ